ncbi:unnamed protein product [Ixodes pacificus]
MFWENLGKVEKFERSNLVDASPHARHKPSFVLVSARAGPGFQVDALPSRSARRRDECSGLAPVPLRLLRLLHALQGEPARPRTHPHGRASVYVQAVLALLQPPQPPHHPPEAAHGREALRMLPLPPDVYAQESARRALSQAPPRRQVGALREGDSCRTRLLPGLSRCAWGGADAGSENALLAS